MLLNVGYNKGLVSLIVTRNTCVVCSVYRSIIVAFILFDFIERGFYSFQLNLQVYCFRHLALFHLAELNICDQNNVFWLPLTAYNIKKHVSDEFNTMEFSY